MAVDCMLVIFDNAKMKRCFFLKKLYDPFNAHFKTA